MQASGGAWTVQQVADAVICRSLPSLKSAKCLKEQQISNLPKTANPKQPEEKILIKCCRQQSWLSGQRGAKNMGKEALNMGNMGIENGH